jgi:hypothetical protein
MSPRPSTPTSSPGLPFHPSGNPCTPTSSASSASKPRKPYLWPTSPIRLSRRLCRSRRPASRASAELTGGL